uniref:Ig-like domain-containing protein n=1 Tax=Amphiprion percula TaxID=161767 RepID=A0A3P8S6X3_AMPPE
EEYSEVRRAEVMEDDAVSPPTFETIMEDLDVCAGETPRFAVVVEGKPIPDILWFKNDILLSESSHYTFVYDDNECSLVVLNARPEDSGVYTCTARNLAGSVSCKAELTIHEGKRSVSWTDKKYFDC